MTFDSFDAVFFTAAFLVPGFVWSAVLSMLVPRKSTAAQLRMMEFLTLSCINYGVWSWALFLLFRGEFIDLHPYWSAGCLFGIVFVSPTLFGLTSGVLTQKNAVAWFLGRFGFLTVHAIPTAWDRHFARLKPYWVLVTLRDGSRVYGLFGLESFAGDDPNCRDLYLEATYRPAETGDWARVEDTGGVLIMADQIAVIEFRKLAEVNYGN